MKKNNTNIITSEEFQKWLGDYKLDTTIGSISKSDHIYNSKKAWKLIKKGEEYWFFNTNQNKGPRDWMKLKITYKRSGVIFYEVLDKRYKMENNEEYCDVSSVFAELLHPAILNNPNPEYFKESNFDTLDGRIKII